MYRYLQSRVPNSQLRVISESGHSVHWEQPETFNRTVLAFLDGGYGCYLALATGWRTRKLAAERSNLIYN